MNYIRHLSGFFSRLDTDERLTPFHVSLYMALFQCWNLNHFRSPLSIARAEIMRLSRIGSVNTYTRCLKELHAWKYLEYLPSRNPHRGSQVIMYRFDQSSDKSGDHSTDKSSEIVVRPYINYINSNKTEETGGAVVAPSLDEVLKFFEKMGWPEKEGKKFFYHYQANGWKVGGKTPMQDWQASSQNWMIKAKSFTHETHQGNCNPGRLQAEQSKNYAEPL